MTPELGWTILAALVIVVWRAATIAADHGTRLKHLEEHLEKAGYRESIDRLTKAVYQLRGALGIVEDRANVRASQHEIDNSEPPKGMR